MELDDRQHWVHVCREMAECLGIFYDTFCQTLPEDVVKILTVKQFDIFTHDDPSEMLRKIFLRPDDDED